MITPEQLRNSARFGTPLRPETLEWLADQAERLKAIDAVKVPNRPRAMISNTAGGMEYCEWADGFIRTEDYDELLDLLRRETVAKEKAEATLVKMGRLATPSEAMREELKITKAERDALKKDAERYRWLRSEYAKGEMTYFAETCPLNESGIDAAIDAAIAGKEE